MFWHSSSSAQAVSSWSPSTGPCPKMRTPVVALLEEHTFSKLSNCACAEMQYLLCTGRDAFPRCFAMADTLDGLIQLLQQGIIDWLNCSQFYVSGNLLGWGCVLRKSFFPNKGNWCHWRCPFSRVWVSSVCLMFRAVVAVLCPGDDKHGGKSQQTKDGREETVVPNGAAKWLSATTSKWTHGKNKSLHI